MKRRLAMPAAVLIITLLLPVGVSATTYPCPDGMVPLPAANLVPEGAEKDHNQNGIVCVKFVDDGVKGGPDDRPSDISDDIIL